MPKTILVTGGAGFIGSHLVDQLLSKGYQVRIIDNLHTGKKENIEKFGSKVDFILGDIREPEKIDRVVRGVDAIIHLAAIASVPFSVEHPILCHEVNVNGTLNLLLSARNHQIHRVVIASSSSVYGNTTALPISEAVPPSPVSPYAAQKWIDEIYAAQFNLLYGMSNICLRFFNVYGPRQDPQGPYAAVIPRFLDRIRNQKKPIIYGTGNQTRDFVYVGNVVSAILCALEANHPNYLQYNVAGGVGITVNQLANEVVHLTGWQDGIIYEPPRPGDVEHSYADISRIRNDLGYQPTVSLKDGLRETVTWYMNQ